MDEKTLLTLEYPKILERLASYTAFSASAELARALHPVAKLEEALRMQKTTSEARQLLSTNAEASVGGSTDIRPLVERAARRGVLDPAELLAVKDTRRATWRAPSSAARRIIPTWVKLPPPFRRRPASSMPYRAPSRNGGRSSIRPPTRWRASAVRSRSPSNG
jgi:hypothetical protein